MNRLVKDLWELHILGSTRRDPNRRDLTPTMKCDTLHCINPLTERTNLLTGNNHEALPVTTHGFLLGVELEDHVVIDHLMHKLVDAISYVEGVGRVEAEHIGEMDHKSLEEEILDAALTVPEPTKES